MLTYEQYYTQKLYVCVSDLSSHKLFVPNSISLIVVAVTPKGKHTFRSVAMLFWCIQDIVSLAECILCDRVLSYEMSVR
jgi:hypothetical protein